MIGRRHLLPSLAWSALALAARLPAQEASPASAPVSAPAPAGGGWLLIAADESCALTVDGAASGELAKGELRQLQVAVGDHLVRARRSRDGAEFSTREAIDREGARKVVAVRFAAPAARDDREFPATLMLAADADCEVSVDETPVGRLTRDEVKRVPVRIEDHFVTAKRPDGSLSRAIVKVERPGQVAVAVSCAALPAEPGPAPVAAAGPSDAELDAWTMTAEDKYAVSIAVNPEMEVSGLPERGMYYTANTFRMMYVVIMRDMMPAALIKRGFSSPAPIPAAGATRKRGGLMAAAAPPPPGSAASGDCRLEIAFALTASQSDLVMNSMLECEGLPTERFEFSRPSENGKVMWLSPTHNKNYIEAYLTPAADELALKLERSRAVKRIAKAKAKAGS